MKKVLGSTLLCFIFSQAQANLYSYDCPSLEEVKSAQITEYKFDENIGASVGRGSFKTKGGTKWILRVTFPENLSANNALESLTVAADAHTSFQPLCHESLGRRLTLTHKSYANCTYAGENVCVSASYFKW